MVYFFISWNLQINDEWGENLHMKNDIKFRSNIGFCRMIWHVLCV